MYLPSCTDEMVTVMQSTTAGRLTGDKNRAGSFAGSLSPELSVAISLANRNLFFTVSTPRLATKARWPGESRAEEGVSERGEGEGV